MASRHSNFAVYEVINCRTILGVHFGTYIENVIIALYTLEIMYRGQLGDGVVVYGEVNDFRVKKMKLFFVLLEIIIGKDIWLTLSRSENTIFARDQHRRLGVSPV